MKSQATAQAGVFGLEEAKANPVYQSYQILHWGFVILPILAGLDKFFMKLVDWSMYLWAPLGNLFGGPRVFMDIVGAVEIVAGFLVAFKPKIGGFIVAFWLWSIIANLLLVQNFYDIALRDFGLSLGAIALARLSAFFDHKQVHGLSV
jgi:hypothetical protein